MWRPTWDVLNHAVPLVQKMVWAAGKYLKTEWLYSILGILAYLCARQIRESRIFFRILLAFNCFYFLALGWLYLTTFPTGEGESLASFDRYFQTLFRTDLFASICLFGISVSRLIQAKMPNFPDSRSQRTGLGIVVFLLVLSNLEQLQFSFLMMNKYGAPPLILAQAPQLIKILDANEWRGQNVWMIQEGESPIVNWQSIYSAADVAGPLAFKTTLTWDPSKEALSPQAIRDILTDQKVVWPISLGSGTAALLKTTLQQNAECPEPTEHYFWIKKGPAGNLWHCIPKLDSG